MVVWKREELNDWCSRDRVRAATRAGPRATMAESKEAIELSKLFEGPRDAIDHGFRPIVWLPIARWRRLCSLRCVYSIGMESFFIPRGRFFLWLFFFEKRVGGGGAGGCCCFVFFSGGGGGETSENVFIAAAAVISVCVCLLKIDFVLTYHPAGSRAET